MSFTVADFFRFPRCKIRENQHPRCYHGARENKYGWRFSTVFPTNKSIQTIFPNELCPLNHSPFQHWRANLAHQFTLFALLTKPCTLILPFVFDTSKLDHFIDFYIANLQYNICLAKCIIHWLQNELIIQLDARSLSYDANVSVIMQILS